MHLLQIVLWLALGLGQQATDGRVEGTVLRAGTTDPIAGALISVVPDRPKIVTSAKNTLTDKEGHFSFTNLAPGSYRVLAQRDGYLSRGDNDAAQLITVRAGERVADLRFALRRAGTISGRIL